MDLTELRKQIDEVDQQIIELLAKRLLLVKNIAIIKQSSGLNINDGRREVELVVRWRKLAASYGLPLEFVEQILKTVLDFSKKIQLDASTLDYTYKDRNNVVIVGYGKMGKSLGAQILRSGFNVILTGRNIEKAENVAREINCKAMEIEEALPKADYIILALSLQAYSNKFVDTIAKFMSKKIVMDILSSKSWVYKHLEELSTLNKFFYISTHPLFGPFTPLLGQKIVIIPSSTGKEVLNDVINFWRCVGLDPVISSYEEHEKSMAVVQVLPHLQLIIFQLAVDELSRELDVDPMKFSTPTFKELTAICKRLSEIKDTIYEIQKNNIFSAFVHEKIDKLLHQVIESFK